MKTIPACLTLGLHALLAATLVASCGAGSPPPAPAAGRLPALVIDLVATTPQGTQSCAGRLYEGVGFKHTWSGFVIDVPEGSPASRAGIVPGDIVSGYEIIDSLHVGDCVTLTVTRGDQDRKMRMCLEMICQL